MTRKSPPRRGASRPPQAPAPHPVPGPAAAPSANRTAPAVPTGLHGPDRPRTVHPADPGNPGSGTRAGAPPTARQRPSFPGSSRSFRATRRDGARERPDAPASGATLAPYGRFGRRRSRQDARTPVTFYMRPLQRLLAMPSPGATRAAPPGTESGRSGPEPGMPGSPGTLGRSGDGNPGPGADPGSRSPGHARPGGGTPFRPGRTDPRHRDRRLPRKTPKTTQTAPRRRRRTAAPGHIRSRRPGRCAAVTVSSSLPKAVHAGPKRPLGCAVPVTHGGSGPVRARPVPAGCRKPPGRLPDAGDPAPNRATAGARGAVPGFPVGPGIHGRPPWSSSPRARTPARAGPRRPPLPENPRNQRYPRRTSACTCPGMNPPPLPKQKRPLPGPAPPPARALPETRAAAFFSSRIPAPPAITVRNPEKITLHPSGPSKTSSITERTARPDRAGSPPTGHPDRRRSNPKNPKQPKTNRDDPKQPKNNLEYRT